MPVRGQVSPLAARCNSRRSGVTARPSEGRSSRATLSRGETQNTGSALRVHAGIIDRMEAEPFDYLDS